MSAVPGRSTILLSSLVFCVASVLLLFEFLAIHCTAYASNCSWVSATLIDWSGGLSCIGWFVGFVMLIDWIVFHTFAAWGPSRRALSGATLKLIASAFFCVQPFSDMAGYLDTVEMRNATAVPGDGPPYYPNLAGGVPWSNFVGILFFHIGNCIDAVGMLPLLDCGAPLSGANLPVYGILTYMSATWLLATAGGIAYAQTAAPFGPAGTVSAGAAAFVAPGQILGAALLLVGSLLYTAWAAFVGRATATEPLLNVVPIS